MATSLKRPSTKTTLIQGMRVIVVHETKSTGQTAFAGSTLLIHTTHPERGHPLYDLYDLHAKPIPYMWGTIYDGQILEVIHATKRYRGVHLVKVRDYYGYSTSPVFNTWYIWPAALRERTKLLDKTI